jgi:antibiotic biosynthesis monooxygenase (ABM) superfamily enzyme
MTSEIKEIKNVHLQNEVTWIICRNIKPGRQKDFDGWFEHYMTLQRNAPGYLGTTVIIPGGSKSSLRYVIHRFTNRFHCLQYKDKNFLHYFAKHRRHKYKSESL